MSTTRLTPSAARRESRKRRRERTERILGRLKEEYPDSRCALQHRSPLELLVATILSAQCTDKRVNMVTPALFERYPTAADYAAADLGELEETRTEVFPGLRITQHVGDLTQLAEEPTRRFRLFLGYAGWGEGQLIREIVRNDWLMAPVREELLFATDPGEAWSAALRSVGVDPSSLPSWTKDGENGSTN